jgi:outer membrane lipoprotein-sorting protein
MNLLLAAVLFVQDKSAEETFKKIEDSILQAKSISVTIRREETEAFGEEVKSILFKEGNKFRNETKGSVKGKAYEMVCICDGKRRYSNETSKLETALKEDNWLQVSLSRMGNAHTVFYSYLRIQGCVLTPNPSDLRQVLDVSNFRFGDTEANGKALLYHVRARVTPKAEPIADYEVTTWYDPATFKPLRRKVEVTDKRFNVTEVYENLTLNADIPDEKFKLPEDKK